ncbi:MAG TPA: amidohydrolase family protein [Jatrophihabitans sp.]
MPNKASTKLILKNGIALVGPELRETPFGSLAVSGDKIVGLSEASPSDSDGVVFDVGGAYVLPGLVDAHVHFDLAAQPAAYERWTDPNAALVRSLTCLHNGLVALRSGITAVRDLGSVDRLVIDYARRVEQGTLIGPRIAAAGRPITITGGHCAQYGRTASGPDDAREAVREQVGAGARVIKVMATGGISTPGHPDAAQFTLEELTAAVNEAHNFGLQVAAHAHAAAGIRMALEAGVDTIEHAGFADEATLEMIKQYGRTLVPTVSALNNIADGAGIPADTVHKSLQARETYRANTAKAIDAGVRIAAGTDAGTALNPLGGLVDELEMYCQRGMSVVEAIRSATVNAGPLVQSQVGTIEVGFRADLLVVASDPRQDLAALRQPLAVIARGRRVPQSWLTETIDELAEVVAG